MTTEPNSKALPVPGADIPYQRFLDCVHCGLCTSQCPTYLETGDENDSPRGRIHLMRAVVDERIPLTDKVQHHLDLCLDCRSCETACPSGVQYGRLLEPFRSSTEAASVSEGQDSKNRLDWFQRWVLHGIFPSRRRMNVALKPARFIQYLKLDRLIEFLGLTKLLPSRLRRMYEQLPKLKPSQKSLPEFLPAVGTATSKVALLTGCVADAMFRHIHWATVRVLQQNGCDVVIPTEQNCCGAIHYHSAAAAEAARLIQINGAAFQDDSLDAVIVNVAGCGAMLKESSDIAEEIGMTNREPIQKLADKVQDINEFLANPLFIHPVGRIDARVVYQDACHLLHAQKVHQQPRQLLKTIPGLTLLELDEANLCCGAAGSYSFTQPEMSDRLANRKLDHLLATKPDLIASSNAGCSLQLQALLKKRGIEMPVVHPIELLDISYQQEDWRSLNN